MAWIAVKFLLLLCSVNNNAQNTDTNSTLVRIGNTSTSISTAPVNGSIPWPGQDNRLPYTSQWGPWSAQQIYRGEGQKPYQPPGIQINPRQAQWFPNSPEYQGFNAQYIARLKEIETSGQLLNTNVPNVIYFPLSSTTTLSPLSAWSTWSEIQNKGKDGIYRQWSNWYLRPDISGQQQEAMNVRQSQRGRLPDGKFLPLTNNTFLDDTHRILVDILAGFVAGTTPRKAAMHNMRTYYTQYRRDYWIGKRYFNFDPQTTLASFITCTYELPSDVTILYEIDETRVEEVLFQCVKYQETCCKLNCCDVQGRPLYYTSLMKNQSLDDLLTRHFLFVFVYLLYFVVLYYFR